MKRKRDEAVPKEEAAEASSSLAAVPPAPTPVPVQSPVVLHREPLQEKEKQPERKKIKISRLSTSSNLRAAEPSPAPASRAPSIAVASPRPVPPAASPRPTPSVAPSRPASVAASPRPAPELERGNSISVLNRPKVQLASAAPSAAASPTPEPARPAVSVRTARVGKKRKLAETETPEAGPSGPPRRMVTLKYNPTKLSEPQRRMLASFPSPASPIGEAAADSIVATPAARARVQATSPLPPNAEASFASTLSAGSSSQTLSASQKTLLPTGKVRKPLPSGPSASSELLGAEPAASTGPSKPRKIVKLKLTNHKLRDAAARCASTTQKRDI